MQVEALLHYYDWEGEAEKYGEARAPLNRASDNSGSDLEERPVRRAYLSEKHRLRAMQEELDKSDLGLEYLVRKRAIAEYEAKKRSDFNQEDFDNGYPPYKLDRNHNHIEVIVNVSC